MGSVTGGISLTFSSGARNNFSSGASGGLDKLPELFDRQPHVGNYAGQRLRPDFSARMNGNNDATLILRPVVDGVASPLPVKNKAQSFAATTGSLLVIERPLRA